MFTFYYTSFSMTKITRVLHFICWYKTSLLVVWQIRPKLPKPCVSLMTRSQMVTHDSRRNEHCAVERKANTLSKLLENSLKTNYYHCFCCTHSLHGNGRRQRLLFTRVYISLKSNLADSARCLAVSNLRERQRVQKLFDHDIFRDNMGAV